MLHSFVQSHLPYTCVCLWEFVVMMAIIVRIGPLKTKARAHAQNWRGAIKATIVARRLQLQSHDRGLSSSVEKPQSWLVVFSCKATIVARRPLSKSHDRGLSSFAG